MARVHVPESHQHDPLSYVWGNYAPEIGAAAGVYSRTVYENSAMTLREMEAARMRTAHINGCHLCQQMRSARDLAGYLEQSGGDPEKAAARKGPAPDEAFYAAILDWRDADCFSDRERLAIEYAERLGEAPKSMDDDEDFWRRMHEHYSDAEIVDMTFSIGSWMALGRFAHVLGLDAACVPGA